MHGTINVKLIEMSFLNTPTRRITERSLNYYPKRKKYAPLNLQVIAKEVANDSIQR